MNKNIILVISGLVIIAGGAFLLTGCNKQEKDYTMVAQQYFGYSSEDKVNHVKSLCESDEYYKQQEYYGSNFYSDKERKLACTTKQKDIDEALKLKKELENKESEIMKKYNLNPLNMYNHVSMDDLKAIKEEYEKLPDGKFKEQNLKSVNKHINNYYSSINDGIYIDGQAPDGAQEIN